MMSETATKGAMVTRLALILMMVGVLVFGSQVASAQEEEVEAYPPVVVAGEVVEPAPPPPPEPEVKGITLPETGSEPFPMALGAGVLLVLGTALVLSTRRRETPTLRTLSVRG